MDNGGLQIGSSVRTALRRRPHSDMSANAGSGAPERRIVRRPVRNALKRKYLEYVAENNVSAYRAWKHFKKEHPNIKENQVRAWIKVKDEIQARSRGSRIAGAGRPPASQTMEEILFEFIFEKRMAKEQVKKPLVKKRAVELSQEMGLPNFKASGGWLRRFFARYDLTLRRTTNLTRLRH